MKEVDSRTEIGQIIEKDLGDHHTEMDNSLDKTLGEEISEEETEKILGTTIHLTRVEVGQETVFRSSSRSSSGSQTGVETGSHGLNVENMIPQPRAVQI